MSLHVSFSGLGKAVAAVAGLALAGSLSACNAENVSFAGKKGVPLAELDLSGAAPTSIALAGPDTVKLTEGEKLKIDVEGSDAMVAAMRFHLDDNTLAILRSKDAPDGETATVFVTMPAPKSLTLAGSGRIEAKTVAKDTSVTIAGSGKIKTGKITTDRLDVNVVGSGQYQTGGSTARLDLNVAGSGNADMEKLRAERANITIAGSGEGAFRSDGKVTANIIGSGKVHVIGRAKCEVSAMGSGKLVCEEA